MKHPIIYIQAGAGSHTHAAHFVQLAGGHLRVVPNMPSAIRTLDASGDPRPIILFERRNKIKKQKTRIESIQYEIDRWYDDLSLKVIDAYTQVTENLAILQSAASSMVHARAQYAVSETDFVNGSIDAQMLSRQKSIENTAIREYEQTRAALNSALLRLEVLTSTRIINR